MTTLAQSGPRPLGAVALLLLLVCALLAPAAPVGAVPIQHELHTQYFTITYPAGEEATAQWYAGFVDDMDTAVSELLGAEPITGLALHIYATEAEYTAANPLAGVHPGIMAHAVPEAKEIGVAVERLREQAPAAARESLRHELTHVVAGALSGQNLPIGFQEGLAQYNELSAERGESVVAALDAAEQGGMALLSWASLNDRRQFQRQIDIAYPQSYTVMAFLAERYGMGAYGRFLAQLRDGVTVPTALQTAYGQPVAMLETAWRAYLPDFRSGGWRLNILNDYDLAPAQALYTAGHYDEAAAAFIRSVALYTDLGRPAQAQAAEQQRQQAAQAAAAASQATAARAALERHDYPAAAHEASLAATAFAALNLDGGRARADEVGTLAARGQAGVVALARAQQAWSHLDWRGAQAAADEAGTAFAALDDGPRLVEVDHLRAGLWAAGRTLGGVAGGLGLLLLLGGGVWAWRTRRAARLIPLYEEPVSWL